MFRGEPCKGPLKHDPGGAAPSSARGGGGNIVNIQLGQRPPILTNFPYNGAYFLGEGGARAS